MSAQGVLPLQETLAEASWSEEQIEKERSNVAARIAALEKDINLAQNEISAGQVRGGTPIETKSIALWSASLQDEWGA